MKDHIIAANALDIAIHNMGTSPPLDQWRRLIPSHWNTANGGGSANIPLMAAVAAYTKEPTDKHAELMLQYTKLALHHFMLSEPFSWTYSSAIVTSWLQAYRVASKHGYKELLTNLESLLRIYFSLLKKMVGHPRVMQDPNREDQKQMKAPVSILCGNRSWGHGYGLGYLNGAWLFTNEAIHGRVKKIGNVGVPDGFAFVTRAIKHPEFQALIHLFWSEAGDPWYEINRAKATSNRVPFQFFRWSNGDALAIMGGNEDDYVDEDTNSNTPGVLAYGCIDGVLHMMPRWPDPKTGHTRVRQKGIKADVDYSETGRVYLASDMWGAQDFRTSPFRSEDLTWAMEWNQHGAVKLYAEPGAEPPPEEPPVVIKPREKPTWIERMGL